MRKNVKKRGHHSIVFTAALMAGAAGAAALSLGTIWFVSKKGRATMDLWTFKVEPLDGPKIEASHEDLCTDTSALNLSTTFCNHVRTARAMVFLTIFAGLYSMLALVINYWRHYTWLFATATIATVVVNICLIASIILGVDLANDSPHLDKPKQGFYMICLGLLFAFIGLILEVVGATRGPRFKNKAQKFRRMFTAKGREENKFAKGRQSPVGAGMGRQPFTTQPRPPPPAPVPVGMSNSAPVGQPASQSPMSAAPLSINISIQPQSQLSPQSQGLGAPTSVLSLPPPSSSTPASGMSMPPLPSAQPTSVMSLPPPSSGPSGAQRSSQLSQLSAPSSSVGVAIGAGKSTPEFRDGGRVSLKDPSRDINTE